MIERVFLRKIGTICNQKKQTFCKAKKNRITDGLGDALFQNQTNFHLRINKISNKHSVKCNPTSSRLTSKIIPLKFLKTLLKILRVLFFLTFFPDFFSQVIIPHHGWKLLSGLWCLNYRKMHLPVKKNWKQTFSSTVLIITTQAEGNYLFSSGNVF